MTATTSPTAITEITLHLHRKSPRSQTTVYCVTSSEKAFLLSSVGEARHYSAMLKQDHKTKGPVHEQMFSSPRDAFRALGINLRNSFHGTKFYCFSLDKQKYVFSDKKSAKNFREKSPSAQFKTVQAPQKLIAFFGPAGKWHSTSKNKTNKGNTQMETPPSEATIEQNSVVSNSESTPIFELKKDNSPALYFSHKALAQECSPEQLSLLEESLLPQGIEIIQSVAPSLYTTKVQSEDIALINQCITYGLANLDFKSMWAFTDGSYKPGTCYRVIVAAARLHVKKVFANGLSEFVIHCETNNGPQGSLDAESRAAIGALFEAMLYKKTTLHIFTDCLALLSLVLKKTHPQTPIQVRLVDMVEEFCRSGSLIITHLRGHAGITENEEVDRLAQEHWTTIETSPRHDHHTV